MYKFLLPYRQRTALLDLCLFCVYHLSIPEDELMEMEIYHIYWILEQYSLKLEKEDSRFANLMCLLANVNRGKNSQPFKPIHFMPKKPKSQKEVEQDILTAFGVK